MFNLRLQVKDNSDKNTKYFELNSRLSQQMRASSAPPDEQLENVQHQLMNAQMYITDLELAKSKYEQIINDKELEMKRLEKEFSTAIADKDNEHAALRAQLDLYKADYEAEANAKDSLMAEKNQIVEDLQSLQRRNQQLIEEVERLRNNTDFVHVGRNRRTSDSTSATDVSDNCFLS